MSLFSQPIQKSVIEQAIADLEKKTSAELRVYVERKKSDAGRSALQQATFLFQQLEMEKTALRNGVLIYLALQSKQCAIVGDQGIDQYVEADFWQRACDLIVEQAKQKQYTQGIVNAIAMIGERLAQYFPYQEDDKNELPNEVVIK
ncbi:TPM domain-containing protein [Gallibacterium anatis]|uniref:Membrane protein n=2 Tax=Gallibacterium TaxID=155493 RepID=A0A0A2Y945_9PAST|nr:MULTISPECIES: TPM domain-containing protein [Gallibacterium]ERF78372.1 membrane protein [Gallibacterium anatis 12656/12]KGQ39652.1 membrane protein [Gallibacterium genomosp. 1]KGQ51064.1 membrane protein [Gallibacterium anatis]KGQ68907.1 membrane protein [Gallibacterium anatis]OBX00086.1 membrane protein [Gallibacterium genomosp. 1]